MKLKSLMLGAAALAAAAASAVAGTVVVSPGNMDGWTFYSADSTGTLNTGTSTGGMVNGPGTAPAGTGSAHFAATAGQYEQLRGIGTAGTLLSAVTSMDFYTWVTTSNSGPSQVPYIQLYLNQDGTSTTSNDRLIFEPIYSDGASAYNNAYPNPNPQPVPALNTWQHYDAMLLGARFYATSEGGGGSGTFTLQHYLAEHPFATLTDSAPGVGGIRFTSGGLTGQATDMNLDKFTFGTAASTTTYDFELAPAAVAVPLPKSAWGGLALIGGLGLVTGAKRMRRQPA